MTTAVVAGALASKPGNGGNAWTRLTWVAALARLGFETWFVEQLGGGDLHRADHAAWARSVLAEEVPDVKAVFLDGDDRPDANELLADADLLLNISGHLDLGSFAARPTATVFLDDDPGYTQLWEEAGVGRPGLADHDVHCTYGLNIGSRDCPVPTVGVTWHALRPPVLLDRWAAPPPPPGAPFTTVATWRSPFGSVARGDVVYGSKHHEFRKILAVPDAVDAAFAVALDIHPAETADLAALHDHGWSVADAASAVGDPASYRRWIHASRAELSPAQGVFVGTACGWLSDRTAAYLASGRPCVVQDTGAGRHLPLGDGLLVYRDLAEAVAGVNAIVAEPEHHARAARALAAEYFDSTTAVARVCELAGVGP